MESIVANWKRYLIISVVAPFLIIFAYVVITYSEGESLIFNGEENGDLHEISDLMLDEGVYNVGVVYSSLNKEGYGMASVVADDSELTHAVDSNVVLLPYYTNNSEYPIYINRATSMKLVISDASEDNPISIIQVVISKNKIKSVFYDIYTKILVIWTFVLIWWLYFYSTFIIENTVSKRNILAILGVILLVNLPCFLDYIPTGVDLCIHLNRLEGIANGLKSGTFPVRIHREMWNGYGYPFGIFYGDAFLYIPAVFYMLGLPLWRAYRLYLVFTNIATILVSYFCFSSICKNKANEKCIQDYGGIIVSFAYSFGIWHMEVAFQRAAVGAYTAFVFIPLIIWGIWVLFDDEHDKWAIRKAVLILALGFAGVAISHMLSLYILVLFFGIFCLCNYKLLFKNKGLVVKGVIASATIAVCASIGFLIPVLDMSRKNDLYVNNFDFRLQRYGIYFSQLFLTDYNINGLAMPLQGVSEDWPQTIGLALIVAIGIGIIYVAENRLLRYRKQTIILIALSFVSTYMATYLCPYDWIQDNMSWLYGVLVRVQTSNRYLLATEVISIVLLMIILAETNSKKTSVWVMIVVASLTLLQGLNYTSEYIMQSSAVDALSNDDAGVVSYSNDYLYLFNDANYEEVYHSSDVNAYDGIAVGQAYYIDNKYVIELSENNITEGEAGYIDIPIWNYSGYQATDNNGNKIKIADGNNHRIEMSITDANTTSIYVQYQEPALWRMCECISFIIWCLMIVALIANQKGELLQKIGNLEAVERIGK